MQLDADAQHLLLPPAEVELLAATLVEVEGPTLRNRASRRGSGLQSTLDVLSQDFCILGIQDLVNYRSRLSRPGGDAAAGSLALARPRLGRTALEFLTMINRQPGQV